MFQGYWKTPLIEDSVNDDIFQRTVYARSNELGIKVSTYQDYVNLLYRLQSIYLDIKDDPDEYFSFIYHLEQIVGKRQVAKALMIFENLI